MEILAKLFGSAAKIKILRLFIFNQNSIYEISDIARRTKVSIAVARKEVQGLEKIKVVKRRAFSKEVENARGELYRKRANGWQLNEKFLYLPQLQKFLGDTTPLEGGAVVRQLAGAGKIRLAVVTGVFTQHWESRIDMLIVGDDIRKGALENAIRDVEAELGIELRYATFTSQDFKYRLSVYDKLVRDVFDYPHQIVIDRLGIAAPKRFSD